VVSSKRLQPRPHLATAALLSFAVSFVAARTFTTFFPSTVLVSGSIHIHHFWFGLVFLAAGGWLGISYNGKDADRIAAILYGAGGGLIVDEIGLLLTFGDYWTMLTFSVLVVLLVFASILILLNTYRQVILKEIKEFERNSASLYFGVFLFAVSIAFIAEATNVWVIAFSTGTAIAALIIILTFFALRTTRKGGRSQNSFVSA
jgi:hypothetical protein